ncbi:hypothetical protein CKAH01_11832 [Colletotrichum kahawae]|uniref:Uncharacterized protein n=1 Tax=Colletotrichum kahawae TaxID=34407 RepID=A0AAD9YS81_COLKA|nr:hypothetical protein CKAH01_11832 [Colletotrichum kahawae]
MRQVLSSRYLPSSHQTTQRQGRWKISSLRFPPTTTHLDLLVLSSSSSSNVHPLLNLMLIHVISSSPAKNPRGFPSFSVAVTHLTSPPITVHTLLVVLETLRTSQVPTSSTQPHPGPQARNDLPSGLSIQSMNGRAPVDPSIHSAPWSLSPSTTTDIIQPFDPWLVHGP